MTRRRSFRRLVVGAAALTALCLATVASASWRIEQVVGSTVEIVDAQGQRRSGPELAGTELTLGAAGGDAADALRLRIVTVVADRVAGVYLHEVEALGASGDWQNVCAADREQRRLALFIEGHDLPDGRQIHVPGEVSITCTAGVQGKCLRAGYVPWDDRHGAGSGQALFQTCTRMYRADYCGDGIGWTRNGTTIDPYDVHGIQKPDEAVVLPFEAGWGPDGATCVHHTRVAERGGVDALRAQCPRLAAARSGATCTPATAAEGALMFNRSYDTASELLTP